MDAKLTLKLDKAVIEAAKVYAKENGNSLSRIIENYLTAITKKEKTESDDIEITPFVKSIATGVSIPSDFNYKEEIADYLYEKYK